MSAFAFVVAAVLPYLAVLIFLVGMIYRFHVWFKTPQPGKMTLFPAPDSTSKGVLAEIFLFPSLFKGDKALWTLAWIFHVSLAIVFLGHIRVFTGLADRMMLGLGMSPDGIGTLSATAGGILGIVLLATGIPLLIRRMAVKRVRQISEVPDYFALLLLIAIVVTGDMMRFGAHFDLAQTREWAVSLLSFSPIVVKNGMFLTHALLAMLLIMIIPFSKILHFGGIFFTQSLIKRR